MANTKFTPVAIQVFEGDDESFTFNVTQNSAAVDLTGYTVTASIRRKPGGSEVLFSQTLVDATDGDFSSGELIMRLSDSQTSGLPDDFWYDVQGVLSGNTTTFVRGPGRVTRHVTR